MMPVPPPQRGDHRGASITTAYVNQTAAGSQLICSPPAQNSLRLVYLPVKRSGIR